MSLITTHVLDAVAGTPAADMALRLERAVGEGWTTLTEAVTDDDGRCRLQEPDQGAAALGTYRLHFATGAWFAAQGRETFYPEVVVTFAITDPERAHHHVPLLLSPFAYSTYRGS